jgi:hypothetical protein
MDPFHIKNLPTIPSSLGLSYLNLSEEHIFKKIKQEYSPLASQPLKSLESIFFNPKTPKYSHLSHVLPDTTNLLKQSPILSDKLINTMIQSISTLNTTASSHFNDMLITIERNNKTIQNLTSQIQNNRKKKQLQQPTS